MQIRNLGRSGLRVSVVGLGCNNFGGRIDLEATKQVVHKALDLGVTFFDESDTYGDPRGSSEPASVRFSVIAARISCWRPNSPVRWTRRAGCRGRRAAT